jgi:tetratricopeptide (TPR) repeat protein
VALTEERYEDAISLAESGMPGDRANPYLPLYLAQAHAGVGENTTNSALAQSSFNKAIEIFHAGLNIYPQEQWLLVGLGSALDELERFDEAAKVYQEAIRWNPTSAQILTCYATHLRVAGQLDEAEAMYKKSLDLLWNPAAITGLELLAEARQARTKTLTPVQTR